MKIITIFLVLFINTAWGQTYPCVPDSLIMNWLNTQNSYQFRREVGIKVTYFDLAGVDGAIDFPKYSYRSNCLSPTAKAKILSLLKGEDYDFKEELDKEKANFYSEKALKYIIKYDFKGDTTRLAEKLDSLYQPMRAEQLASLKAGEYSEELIRFVGLIYFHDAISILKAELKSPNRYAEIPKQELIKQTLARFGDSYWQNYFSKKFQRPSKEYYEFITNFFAVRYINNAKLYQTFLKTELNNNIIGYEHYSDYTKSSPMWQKVIDEFINEHQLDKSYIEKFGKTLYDKIRSEEEIHTLKIKKGILEILEACKYDCLVDYSQKERK